MDNLVDVYQASLDHLLQPVKRFLDADDVSEVMINGHDQIYVERAGKLELAEGVHFRDAGALQAAMRNIAQYVNKRLTPDDLSVEARLPDGSRVHIVQAPAARNGLCATIRKFSKQKLTIADLVKWGTLSAEAEEVLGICALLAKNIIVSGGTGSGKTTLLNCLSAMIPEDERLIVIEDSSELQLAQDHVVSFEVQPPDRHGRGGISVRDLFRASLRMRPDRIIVGECRGGEALDMIQAMTSGHSGSLSTVHANNPGDALNRLETLALMSGIELPLVALRAQLGSAVDLIVQITRFHDGRRRVVQIAEVLGLDEATGRLRCEDLFRIDHSVVGPNGDKGVLRATGRVASFADDLALNGLDKQVICSHEIWGMDAG